jgi:creatinine amidohydrolase
MAVMEDLVRSAYQTGFRRVLVLNGHGGNSPARAQLMEVANSLPEIQLRWYDWWLSHSVEAVGIKHGIKPAHANWLEAFPFTIVGELPETPKLPPSVPGIMDARTARAVYGDGSFGGPYRASEEVMHELFAASLEDVLQLLKFE